MFSHILLFIGHFPALSNINKYVGKLSLEFVDTPYNGNSCPLIHSLYAVPLTTVVHLAVPFLLMSFLQYDVSTASFILKASTSNGDGAAVTTNGFQFHFYLLNYHRVLLL